MVIDVTEQDFEQEVLERSKTVPVVVDFWAEWCGPCRQLTPALENAARAREGDIDLAKVDTDKNQSLAAALRIQGIPAVKAFRDGEVVDQFTGAIPPSQVEAFFDRLVPSEAERLAADAVRTGDEDTLRRALEEDPGNAPVAAALARKLLARREFDEAAEVLEPFEFDFIGAGLAARARLQREGDDLDAAFDAWDRGRPTSGVGRIAGRGRRPDRRPGRQRPAPSRSRRAGTRCPVHGARPGGRPRRRSPRPPR